MKKQPKVYLSGPISGLERDEYMARFAYAEELVRKDGYDVCNPTRLLPCRWPWLYRLMGYKLTLRYDIWHLKKCDRIFMLPGWVTSIGAIKERNVALRNGIEMFCPNEWYNLVEYIDYYKSIKEK